MDEQTDNVQQQPRKILQMNEVAQRLGVSMHTARQWAKEGRIPCFRFNNKGRWRAFEDELDAYIKAHQAT